MQHTLPRAVLAYMGGLVVSQGEGLGAPLNLFPWELRFLRRALRPRSLSEDSFLETKTATQ